MIGHHVTMRLRSSQVLAPTTAARRGAARIFHAVGWPRGLFAFRFADTHAHALLVGSRKQAGRFANLVEVQLRWHLALDSPFEPARFTPIETQRHLDRAFRYLIAQEEHHGIDLDPMHEASSACDVVGLRALGTGLAQRTRELLPRLSADAVLQMMQLETCEPDFLRLADAAAAACALLDLSGREPATNRARVGAVHAAAELSTNQIATALGVTRRCVERARKRAVDPSLVKAIRMQLTFRPRASSATEDWPPAPADPSGTFDRASYQRTGGATEVGDLTFNPEGSVAPRAVNPGSSVAFRASGQRVHRETRPNWGT